MRFNLCNGYGSTPTDSCLGKDYADETEYLFNYFSDSTNKKTLTNMQNDMIISAKRKLNENGIEKLNAQISKFKQINRNGLTSGDNTIFDSRVSWNDIPAKNALLDKNVPTWPHFSAIQKYFQNIRDVRYHQDPEKTVPFLRRITWLYPDDDCWQRAAAAVRDFFGPLNNPVAKAPRPARVYFFGNLCVNTPNTKQGYAAWAYHVAPIVKDGETSQYYVLDPAVNPYNPLTLEKWVESISGTTGACASSPVVPPIKPELSVCNGYGINVIDPCQQVFVGKMWGTAFGEFAQAYRQISPPPSKVERQRQIELGRDPDKVLGDFPPWRAE